MSRLAQCAKDWINNTEKKVDFPVPWEKSCMRTGKKAWRLPTCKSVHCHLHCVAPFWLGFSALNMLEIPDRIPFSLLEHLKGPFRHT
jgi:hypothetical protein